MEAPDKIWINTDTLNGYHISNHPLYGEEYIRKDALLEWIQEIRAIPHENAIIRDLTFQEVINKLNSM